MEVFRERVSMLSVSVRSEHSRNSPSLLFSGAISPITRGLR